jgi:hypothetical protein
MGVGRSAVSRAGSDRPIVNFLFVIIGKKYDHTVLTINERVIKFFYSYESEIDSF